MQDFKTILNYIAKHEPNAKLWPRDKFEKWVQYYFSEGFICTVLDDSEKLCGLAMIRPVLTPLDADDQLAMDYEGTCLCIVEVIATAPGALQALGFAVLKRFGMRKYVAYHRPPLHKLEVHKASSLRRNLLRSLHHESRKF